MLSGINPSSSSDDVNRQSSAIAKRREQLRRWDESETNRESSNIKHSQRVKFEQAYVFLAACSSEDRDEIDKLIQRGVNINTSNIDGLTALHQACIDDNLLMVEYLLNKNADINCQDNEGWTPLHAAASCGNIDIVKYLLSHGAIVDVCNNEGELAIDIAEDGDIIAFLENDMRRKGIDDQQSRNLEHQLMVKYAQDCLNNNKTALKLSSDTVVHTRTGATALHVAAAKGYLDVIDLLIRAGANINSVDKDGWTPLHAAAHWDKLDVIKYLIDRNADLDAKNYAGQTPVDVCDGETFELLKELKSKRPPTKNEPPDALKRKPVPTRPIDEQKSILRSESYNENLDAANKPPPQPPIDENLSNCPPNIKEKLSNLQRSLHDLSNRYLKANQEEPTTLINSSNLNDSKSKQIVSSLSTSTTPNSLSRTGLLSTNKYSLSTPPQRTYTNPLQSLTTINLNNESYNRENSTNSMATTNVVSSPTPPPPPPLQPPPQSLETKINRRNYYSSTNETQPEVAPRRWGTTDRTVGDGTPSTTNNTGPYVRRRSAAGEPPTSAPSTLVSVTTSLSPPSSVPTTNVTVTTNAVDDAANAKRRTNLPPNRDDEAEAQRKHRSAQARRERRSTQSVTVEDIKAAEQQIKNRPNETPSTVIPPPLANINELSNNKIGAPSTPSASSEHDIETERLQRVIEEKKDKARRASGGNEDMIEANIDASRRPKSRFTSAENDNPVPTVIANDSLNLVGSTDSQRRKTNRVHNQRKNTGRIIWNDETKEVEIQNDSNEESHRSDDQKLQENAQQSALIGSRGLISRFENTPKEQLTNLSPTSPPLSISSTSSLSATSRINRSQSQEPTKKSLTVSNSVPMNGISSSTSSSNIKKESNDAIALKQYEDTKRKIDEFNQKVDRLERDITERDQIIEKLKTSQYIESSLDKREKRAYERKISELEEEIKKMDSIKADNTRLKEENAALIRVISKLSK